jgi:hypothetical protein
MKNLILIFTVWFLFPTLAMAGEKEETYLKETMIPLARDFLQRTGQTNNLPTRTNQIKSYKLDFFNDRSGCLADLRLTNGFSFSFHTETNRTEVWAFNRPVKTYYALENAPREKIEAVKALNLKNKLNKESALMLAKNYFKLAGRKEENFHPPEIIQCYWSGEPSGKLPYYEITWYRKDVNLSENGNPDSKLVIIEVSGIDSSLISYLKGGMPIGSDF